MTGTKEGYSVDKFYCIIDNYIQELSKISQSMTCSQISNLFIETVNSESRIKFLRLLRDRAVVLSAKGSYNCVKIDLGWCVVTATKDLQIS